MDSLKAYIKSRFITTVFLSLLGACGGGGCTNAVMLQSDAALTQPQLISRPTSSQRPLKTTAPITNVAVEGFASTTQSNVPITFGQVFAMGDVAPGESIVGRLANGQTIPLQLDAKATHADGSLRHGIISTVLPRLTSREKVRIDLVKVAAAPLQEYVTSSPSSLLNAGFKTTVVVLLDGEKYQASAEDLLRQAKNTRWLSGPIVTEWLAEAPLKTVTGREHPHLQARFAVRSYKGINKVRVDITIENNWAYEPAPQNFTYDIDILLGGTNVYSKQALVHFHHARWRKTFWWGGAQDSYVRHDHHYLISTRAVPNYDTEIEISEAGLNNLQKRWMAAKREPMGAGILEPAMPRAGGRPDIGPLPQWAALYLLSMDQRAWQVTYGTGELAGSWPIHYRDKNTLQPVSVATYPYMTLLGIPTDTDNPKTKKREAFPSCVGNCTTAPYNFKPDSAHQPSLAYIPYMLSGDHFFLEELHYWANYNVLQANPGYRKYEKGLLAWDQVRGQAWSLRTLGHAAYITPDVHPLKDYFTTLVHNNVDWYNDNYVKAEPNKLGIIGVSKDGNAVGYTTSAGVRTGVAPWMDDFFTWTVGYLTELGFYKSKPLLEWKSQFPVQRMIGPNYCWIDGAEYALVVRPHEKGKFFETIGDAYYATFTNSDGTKLANSKGSIYLDLPCASQEQADWRTQRDIDRGIRRSPWLKGEMTGFSSSPEGFPANMQPALAVAASSNVVGAIKAWTLFNGRAAKPDYSKSPQWAIVPRVPLKNDK